MLKLVNVTKDYSVGNMFIHALKGVSLDFEAHEFVSVLGPSGCGKTTLLNIIGGLDQYTRGDMVINGRSTKDYRDSDWDSYRNHSIGFVFQTYNLIPHQTVLSNVELALTLSGVSKAERVERAKKVIEQVGLSDQLHKKPTQLSGGQMQRVAIARALVNNPDILLADEPTGALDSETSVQIMEILKEISKEKLVIMVTHNPELADKYSTRIVKLLDGLVTSDTNPAVVEDVVAAPRDKREQRKKKTSMSFFTALSLSLNNLLTKKARTFLTAFAGSIGIIGIALILSLSNGLQSYIDRVEEDTLSTYPITIEQETIDIGGMMQSFMGSVEDGEEHTLDRVYTFNIMGKMINSAMAKVETNDLAKFMEYIEANPDKIKPYTTDIAYGYGQELNLYKEDGQGSAFQVNPSTIFSEFGMAGGQSIGGMSSPASSMMTNYNMWKELISNSDFLETQYDVIAGDWPQAYNEVVLIVDEQNEISDIMLYSLGLKGPEDAKALQNSLISGTAVDESEYEYAYDEIIGLNYSLVLPTDYYEKTDAGWVDMREDEAFMNSVYSNAQKIKIVGILRPNEDAVATSLSSSVGYTFSLTEYIINQINSSEIVKEQNASPETDIFTGLPFEAAEPIQLASMEEVAAFIQSMPDEASRQEAGGAIAGMQGAGMPDEQIIAMFNNSLAQQVTDATLPDNLKTLGVADLKKPTSVNIYASSFDNKEAVTAFIDEYNSTMSDEYRINYTDYIGLLMSSVSTVINAISYILIAFVSISLVVSSIMIGIITYISVLERTKEIGILRSVGASKKDISRVFNAETLIVGFVAGALGILVTVILCIPANAIIKNLTDISNIALLPAVGAAILVGISMVLTFISGLIPSRIAANKDPVVALRTE